MPQFHGIEPPSFYTVAPPFILILFSSPFTPDPQPHSPAYAWCIYYVSFQMTSL